MKLKEIYDVVIKEGIKEDPRGKDVVEAQLKRVKKSYDKMSDADKKNFDTEELTNPYSDTRILYGDENIDVKKAMVGIDIDVSELLLADRLSEKGDDINLVIAHHPAGIPRLKLFRVMDMQTDILEMLGVPINIAEGILEPRISEVRRKLLPTNVTKTVDAAKLLDLPFMCTHTPADNHVVSFLQKRFDKEKPETLGDVLDVLEGIHEYRNEKKKGSGLLIMTRSKSSEPDPYKIRAGKVFVDMTGGTGGSIETFEKLAQRSEIGTLVGMHIGEEHREMAKKYNMNVVIAGHMASDTLGMNLMLDKLEKKEKLEVVSTSGFERYSRLK